MNTFTLEACVDSVESALAAAKGGANRLEVCANLIVGGTTPGISLFKQIRKVCDIPVHVLIRPRYGDFLYTDYEFQMIKEDVRQFASMGADGIVAGCLKEDGNLDLKRMKILREEAKNCRFTLHRAFDLCRDPHQALEEAVCLGIDAILTSGQKNTCTEGKQQIRELIEQSRGRIEILVGSGVDADAVSCLMEEANARSFHLSGKTVVDSRMIYRREQVSMGISEIGEYSILRTDEEKIRQARKQIEKKLAVFSKSLKDYAEKTYKQRLPLLGMCRNTVEKELEKCSEEEQILMKFLYGTMPLRDAGEYDFSVFLGFVRHSLMLYKTKKWCRDIPEEIFLHYVLYYRVNSENIEDCRRFFYDQLAERIDGMRAEEAVLEINYWCAENASYQCSDDRTISPLTVYSSGNGRCGEESVFAVTAFRSVGIPARQVYTPRWAHCDDNHAWVEVYTEGKWHFLGACEPEEVLDKGWFVDASSRAMFIHSMTFSDYSREKSKEYLGREGGVSYFNETASYALSKVCRIFVVNKENTPIEGALVSAEVLNMAEYSSAVSLYTDKEGMVSLELGLGDIHLYAQKEEYCAETTINVNHTNQAVLHLTKEKRKEEIWEDMDVQAPADYPVHLTALTPQQKEKNRIRIKQANHLRESRILGYFQEDLAAAYPDEREILLAAGGNFSEIYRFLSKDNHPDRKALLHSLPIKDCKDARAEILESHLSYALRFRDKWESQGKRDIFIRYILCPRIYLEELTDYRRFILEFFSEEEKEEFSCHPEKIWRYIQENIRYDPKLDYPVIPSTPSGCLRLLWGSPLSRKLLFVGICRTLGIPSRINPVSLEAEVYRNGKFFVQTRENQEGSGLQGEGRVILLSKPKEEWRYHQNWTIGKLDEGRITSFDYTGFTFSNNQAELLLKPGKYRLITSCRLPNGNQKASQYWFSVKAGQDKLISMRMRSVQLKDMLAEHPLDDIELEDEAGKKVSASFLLEKTTSILAFLSPGEEPTEHVLNEFLACKERFRKISAQILFILPEREALNHPLLNHVIKEIPAVRIACGEFPAVTEPLARRMYIDPEKLPLLLLVRPGMTGIYGCSGYHAGSVELIYDLLQLVPDRERIMDYDRE